MFSVMWHRVVWSKLLQFRVHLRHRWWRQIPSGNLVNYYQTTLQHIADDRILCSLLRENPRPTTVRLPYVCVLSADRSILCIIGLSSCQKTRNISRMILLYHLLFLTAVLPWPTITFKDLVWCHLSPVDVGLCLWFLLNVRYVSESGVLFIITFCVLHMTAFCNIFLLRQYNTQHTLLWRKMALSERSAIATLLSF
jgi:hypothetical protein